MPSDALSHWKLDPAVTFLNHGSFGACPRVVLDAQSRLRDQLESEPVRFMVRELEPLADNARRRLATVLGADADDLAFVRNATEGVNTVLKSLQHGEVDELLVTSHCYNAVKNAVEATADRIGAFVTVIPIPFPLHGEDVVLNAIAGRLGGRKQFLVVDHITSPTALVMPVDRIVALAAKNGVTVLVDGAHAPGMVPLSLQTLGADYYVGNCHKWLCAPKGVGFLWARRSSQQKLSPLVISHGRNSSRTERSRYRIEFDWTGTHDPTAYLALPAAIDFMESFIGGLTKLMADNRALALEGRRILLDALQQQPAAPESMIGSMATVLLPDGSDEPPKTPLYSDPLQDTLLFKHHLEVPVAPFPASPRRVLRISAQKYNAREDYEVLARALKSELS